MKKQNTKKDADIYEEYLNAIGCPEYDLKINGGRCPDGVDYGKWLRQNDPISFNVGFKA
jgi:hypothetical protein